MSDRLEKILGSEIMEVGNPSRYFGPEFYYNKKIPEEGDIKCAMCFPDLYEIGMSNNAMRIIYDTLNKIDGVFCDRVFSVAPDFEKLLRSKDYPLFTIQEHIPVNSLDYLGITMGCELAATNILQVLDLSHLSLDKDQRKETDPVVILGGPAATNPLPFSKFVDFVHIGEAEADSEEIVAVLKKYKTRSERIKALKEIPYLWYKGKKIAKRAIDKKFGEEDENPVLKHYVVPSIQVAQDHGTAEIMRGCPNGCRFCHAGQYYKPFRQRSIRQIYDMVSQSVNDFGYREVTLSSLSSGDYPDLDLLIKALNLSFKNRGISFSLPSLKVSSFSLNILEQLSEVRKSGLTFAIETPVLDDQRALNKEVPVEQVIEIIQEAKRRGYKLAKFYFMTGLPFTDLENEERNIVSFLSQIHTATKINMNINIGTFIPKAHTPFQWAKQMSMEDSANHLKSIKRALMTSIPGIKVSYHEPSISFLEGVISRGSYQCCELIELAYKKGCRLDAWDEYLCFDKWQEALAELNYTYRDEFAPDEVLPWDSVSMNVSKAYLLREYNNAKERKLTSICSEECNHNCAVCGEKAAAVHKANNTDYVLPMQNEVAITEPYHQAVFTYAKKGRAVYNSHIAVMRQFEMAFQRSGLHVKFTEGFNPKPKMEFLNPITMGVEGENELLLVELPVSEINVNTVSKLNSCLAEGFNVKSVKHIPKPASGAKISLASLMKGCIYSFSDITDSEISKELDLKLGENKDYKLTKNGDNYILYLNGEKNLFKLLFNPEMSKFHITGSCKMVRESIDINLSI